MRLSVEERFWSHVDKRGTDECWPWLGSCDSNGYGSFTWERKSTKANRVAFFLVHGFYPTVVMHSCDNRPCCNVAHLRAGTQAENIADRHAKGRDNWTLAVQHSMEKRRAQTHCKRGHELSGNNLTVSPQGFRHCKACAAFRAREKYALKKAATS